MAKEKQTTPETWQDRYSSAVSNQSKMFKRFSNWYDSLYAVVGVTPSPWRSKMYVPVLARQTWALVSKFLAIKPGWQVKVNDPNIGQNNIEDKAEKAQRKLEYDYENPYMDETMRDKLFAALLDATVTGTGLVKVCWKVDESERYERLPSKDGTVDLTKEKKTTKKIAYNDIEPVNIFNVYVSPAATNLYDAPWIIIKEYKSKEELQEANDLAGVEIYKNLDKVQGVNSQQDDTSGYNFSRNRLTNEQNKTDKTVSMLKIFECYESDMLYTYAESGSAKNDSSWVLLRSQKNPYWHGKYPLVKFHVKSKPFQFWGEGLFETTYRLQAGYNDAFNHFMDQWNLSENSMLMMPETGNVNDYVVEPGGVLTYRGDQAPQQFKHASPDGNMLQSILALMDRSIEGVTISQYAAGLPNSATDKTKGTATGIMHLQEAAGDIVSFMRNNFQQSVTQIGRMWLSNNQQYMQDPITVMYKAKGEKKQATITPQDLQGDMELMIDDKSMDPANQDQKVQQFLAYVNQVQQLQQASVMQAQSTKYATPPLYVDFAALLESFSQIVGVTNYDKMMLPSDQVSKAMEAAQSPEPVANERFSTDINQLYGSEAAQWLQKHGIQADPQRMQQVPNIDPAKVNLANVEVKAQKNHADMVLKTHDHALKTAETLAPSPNPQADQNVVDMAHGLMQSGHLTPDIMQHLPQLPPSQQQPAQQTGNPMTQDMMDTSQQPVNPGGM